MSIFCRFLFELVQFYCCSMCLLRDSNWVPLLICYSFPSVNFNWAPLLICYPFYSIILMFLCWYYFARLQGCLLVDLCIFYLCIYVSMYLLYYDFVWMSSFVPLFCRLGVRWECFFFLCLLYKLIVEFCWFTFGKCWFCYFVDLKWAESDFYFRFLWTL